MKKILYLLMLAPLFASCSDDDNSSPGPKGGDDSKENIQIDKRVVGKWKVDYSRMIYLYMPNTSQPSKLYYKIFEYFGDYDGTPEKEPEAGLFDDYELSIELAADGKMKIISIGNYHKLDTVYTKYRTRNDSIFRQIDGEWVNRGYDYKLNSEDELIIGFKDIIGPGDYRFNPEYLAEKENYLFSRYKRVKE